MKNELIGLRNHSNEAFELFSAEKLKTDGNHGEVIYEMKEHNEVSNFHNSTYVRKSFVSAPRQAKHRKWTPVFRPYDPQLCF